MAIPFVGEVVAEPNPRPNPQTNQRPQQQQQQQQQRRNMWNGWGAVPRPVAATQVSPLQGMMRWRNGFLMLNMITVRMGKNQVLCIYTTNDLPSLYLESGPCLIVCSPLAL